MEKSAGTMAAIWVILSVMGLLVLIGVILVMMWFGPGIQHSPSESGMLFSHPKLPVASGVTFAAQNRIYKDAA